MKPYREVAALAVLQVICFLLLSYLEPDFFLLHFLQTLAYLAILIMLFYMEARWAYMLGIMAPAVWLVMVFASGFLGGTARQVLRVTLGHGLTNAASCLAAISVLLSVLMIVACVRRWEKEYAGLGKSGRTVAVTFGIVAVYYGIPGWRMIPLAAAEN